MKSVIITSVCTVGLALSAVAYADSVDVQPVFDFDLSELDGTAILTRTDTGAGVTINTKELRRLGAHTVWWIAFTNPDQCETSCDCGSDADFDQNAKAAGTSVFWATGRVVDVFGQGNFAANASYGEFPTGFDQVLLDNGGILNEDTEVHVVVRDHGRPIPRHLDEQLTQFDGGCSRRNCADVQFAVFPGAACL